MTGARPARPVLLRWGPRALTVVAVLAATFLAVGGIAGQLAGRSVLAATDSMVMRSPYREAGFAGTTSANAQMFDVYTAELPSTILFRKSLDAGHPAMWNPYAAAGTPLGSITNNALGSPLTLPAYVLPNWLAPACQRLAEVVCGLVGSYFFLRRLRLSQPSALVGGMIYANSAFLVTWMGWPQTRVAAFIPMLFWATERFLQERRPRDVAILAAVSGSLLLGGFPSVEGYAFLTVGCYALTRLLAEHRSDVRQLAKSALGLGLGYAAGLGLALFQVLPFTEFYSSWLIEGRGQAATTHLDPVTLVSAFAPWAFGGVSSDPADAFILSSNPVESISYLGAAAVILALVGLVLARRGRALPPQGVWVFLASATVVWGVLVYRGGLPLEFLQHVPMLRSLFASNFIGRARSMTGFLTACLAAVGFDLLLHRREQPAVTGRARWLGRGAVGLVVVAVLAGSWHEIARGWSLAKEFAAQDPAVPAIGRYGHEVLIGGLLALAAAICVAALWFAGQPRKTTLRVHAVRASAATVVLFLIAGQSVQFVHRYSPQADKPTFYPVTDTHAFLAANLGGQRLASTDGGMVLGTDSAYGLRSLNGHTFLNAALATLVEGIPGNPIPYPTYLSFGDDPAQAGSPILDRLGVEYFVAALAEQVFGRAVPGPSDGTVDLRPGVAMTAAVPSTGPLRAVGFIPQTGLAASVTSQDDPDNWVDVVVHDSSGAQVAETKQLTAGMQAGVEFEVPVAADDVPPGTALTATLTLHTSSPVTVAAQGGRVALSAVAGVDDGLKLVHTGTSVIYQRLAALPRIRWATSAVVIPDQGTRVHTLATGSLPRSTVVLDAPGPAAGGAPATVKVNEDGADEISVGVSAQGAGYLVVADADQVGWGVTVDGKKAELVAADEGVVAVAVPAGTHTVALHYSSPDGGLGAAISVVTAVALLAAVGGEVWWSRRRRQPAGVIGGGPVVSAASDEAGADPVADPVADPAADPRPEQDADALRGLIREAGSDDKSSTGLREPPLDGPERSGAPPG